MSENIVEWIVLSRITSDIGLFCPSKYGIVKSGVRKEIRLRLKL